MESEECIGNSEADNSINERRQRMLARLEARHAQHVTASKIVATTDVTDFEKLLTKAMHLINSPELTIEPEFLQEMETAVTMISPGHQLRRLKEALNTLRNRLQEQFGMKHQKTTFSFTSRKDINESHAMKSVTTDHCPNAPIQTAVKDKIRMERAITVTDKHDEELITEGTDGEEVVINNVMGCVIRVPFKASAVRIKSVKHSTLIFAPVKTSFMIRNCEDLTVVVAAQQIRVHDSHQMRFYIEVSGAIIIEDCDGVEVAPYNVTNIERDPQNDKWRNVQDFNWVSTEEQSPNWKIMMENSEKCFTL